MTRPRLIVLGTLVVLAAGLLALAFGPILANLAQANQDTLLLQHLRGLAAEKPRYERQLSEAQNTLVRSGVLYQGGAAELESAALQNTAQSLVAQAGGQVSSAAIDPAQNAHGLQLLAVSLSFTLPASALPALLTSIDAQLPYLQITSLDARQGTGGMLNIDLQLSAFGASP